MTTFKWTILIATALASALLFGMGCSEDANGINDTDVVADAADVEDTTGFGEMRLVPSGSFWMGCNYGVTYNCNPQEIPYHEVTLDGFYVDRTEVTIEDFQVCVDAGVCSHHLDDQTCFYLILENGDLAQSGIWPAFRGANQPMVCVDWEQANQYCEWAGKHLPTEAEWEKAARGTDGRMYPWGNDGPDCDDAVVYVGDGSECAPEVTADVCTKSPNGDSPYGLCDMAGNVREWVADWYDASYYNTSPTTNPKGPDTGLYRTIRGSSFYPQNTLTNSGRLGAETSKAFVDLGFRCVRSAETSEP